MYPRDRGLAAFHPTGVTPCPPSGAKERLVAYVRTGSRRFRDQFLRACRQLGLEARVLQTFDGWETAYLVRGTAAALAAFTRHRCVRHWHPVLAHQVPYRGTGWGERPKRRRHPLDERLDALRARAEAAADEEQLCPGEGETDDADPGP